MRDFLMVENTSEGCNELQIRATGYPVENDRKSYSGSIAPKCPGLVLILPRNKVIKRTNKQR
jgi:hypothetical protein